MKMLNIQRMVNEDITGDDRYSIVWITKDSRKACEMEMEGQIYNGYFENNNVIEVLEADNLEILEEWVLKLMLVIADYLGWSTSLESPNREVILEYGFVTQCIDCKLDPKSLVISLLSKIRNYAESEGEAGKNKECALELYDGMKQAASLHGYVLEKAKEKEFKLKECSVAICDVFENLLD